MQDTLTTEQRQLVETVRGRLNDDFGREQVTNLDGWEPADLLPDLAAQGWFELAGRGASGVGFTPVEEVLLCREIGRTLAPVEIVGSVLLASLPDEASELLQGGLADVRTGACTVGLSRFTRVPTDDGQRRVVIVGRSDAGLMLHFDGLDAVRILHATEMTEVDSTAELDPVTSTWPASIPEERYRDSPTLPPDLGARALILVAAVLAGVAEATLEMSVAFVKQREQFGRPIGAFQAVKHRCANMAVQAAIASSATTLAARAADDDPAHATHFALAASLAARRAARSNAAANVQNHGAVGFTHELGAHLFVRRAALLRDAVVPEATLPALLMACRTPFQ